MSRLLNQIRCKNKTISYVAFECTSYFLFLKIKILIQNIRTLVQKENK